MRAFLSFLFFYLLAGTYSAQAGLWDYLSLEWKKSDYTLQSSEDYQFNACRKFKAEDEKDYYIRCNYEGHLAEEDQIERLNNDVKAVSLELLENSFLKNLKSRVLSDLRNNYSELISLKACLKNNLQTKRCQNQREALLTGLRRDLPRVRALMAQMNVPGKIYSPTKPERFQRELTHSLTDVKIKDLSQNEVNFLKKHTEDLESSFRRKVISERSNFSDCIDKNPCRGKEPIIDTHISRLFDEQNDKYENQYRELISTNPMLTLVSIRGDESQVEIFNEVEDKLEFLKERAQESINHISGLKGDDMNELLGLTPAVENYLTDLNTSIHCDLASKIRDDLDMDELKTDLLIGAGALLGGGVCAFTFGVGCAVGVAIGAEAIAIGVSQDRYQTTQNFFYSGQADANRFEDRQFERNLSLYLAPLALVGEGIGSTTAKVVRRTSSNVPFSPSKRLDIPQRKAIDEIDNELGKTYKNRLLRKFNPGNKYGLSRADQTYLAGVASILLKRIKSEKPNMKPKEIDNTIKKHIDNVVKECQAKN